MPYVNLWYLAKPADGGWVSYTVHLARALHAVGMGFRICRAGAKMGRNKPWAAGLEAINIPAAQARKVAEGTPYNIVTCVDKHHADYLRNLWGTKFTLVVHDPTELKEGLLTTARMGSAVRTVTIRRANVPTLAKRGVNAAFVPHPYVPSCDHLTLHEYDLGPSLRQHACAISRLDWDKQTHVIAEANKLLRAAGNHTHAVDIYGAENRLYTHHKVALVDPNWRIFHRGPFARAWGAAVQLAANYRYVVDLSKIAGDGGGTQYTFLEAWEGGAHLVVSRAWLRDDDRTLEHGRNCTAVADAAELVARLHQPPDRAIIAAGRAQLADHAPALVVPAMLHGLGAPRLPQDAPAATTPTQG